MSTTAPPRTDPLTEADEELLARLDPDQDHACQFPGCDRAAVTRIRCRRSDSTVVQCSEHTRGALSFLAAAALLHRPATCVHCRQDFCSHAWPSHYEVTPLHGAA